eukprot:scaffold2423_cov113-Isochrysis_galbana.AAC.19
MVSELRALQQPGLEYIESLGFSVVPVFGLISMEQTPADARATPSASAPKTSTVGSKVVHDEKRRTGGMHGRKHLIDNGLNHARLTGMRGTPALLGTR